MDLTHRFSVPAQMDEAWNAFNDLEGLAPCFPGATISSVEGDEFSGSVKIKLGPIALVYNGSGRYVERNDAERRVVIEARGKDKRGNGTATATVTAKFAGNGDQTQIEVFTDLAITGKPAQFGRGVISDVSDKLLDQFVSCVSDRFAQSGLGAAQAPRRLKPQLRPAQRFKATSRTPSRRSSSRRFPQTRRWRRSLPVPTGARQHRRPLPRRPPTRPRQPCHRLALASPRLPLAKAPSMCSARWARCS